jgi:hypothetical protein
MMMFFLLTGDQTPLHRAMTPGTPGIHQLTKRIEK